MCRRKAKFPVQSRGAGPRPHGSQRPSSRPFLHLLREAWGWPWGGGQRMRHTSLRGGQGGPAFWWWERALRPVGKRCSERGPGPGGALRLQQRQVARSTRPGSLRPQRAPQGTAPILEVPAAPAQEPLWPTGLK